MAAAFIRQRFPYRSVYKTHLRHGYIVLLPESTQDNQTIQTVFTTNELPRIKTITTEECISIVGKVTLDFESGLWKLEEKCQDIDADVPSNLFEDILHPLEKVSAPLDVAWGMMKTLYLTSSSVMPETCYMNIHDRARRARSQRFNSEKIFVACKKQDLKQLSEEQRRVVSKYILEGQLNGVNLKHVDKTKLKTILHKINVEKITFRNKVKIATENFRHTIADPNIVRDFPENVLKSMAHDRLQYGHGPWTVTLQPPIYTQFMEHCPVRDLRWNVWQANVRRSSNDADRSIQTSTHIQELRSLRNEQARLLNFESFAHMSMKTKMAGSFENVQNMLERLRKKAYLAQGKEIRNLQEFADSRGFEGTLELWDVPYWKRKQLKNLHNFDEEKLREYFPLSKVQEELFGLCQHLFGLEIVKESSTNIWHSDVQFYNIFDRGSAEPIASFYLDLFARSGEKKGIQNDHGWMIALRNNSKICGHKPLAALLFNFMPPSDNQPSLLSFKEVQQFFQKFGHALQHLLATSTYADVSGLSNVEWDAVEVCSNFMAHWLCHAETVRKLSCHYQTGEQLPEEVLKNIELWPRLLAGHELCQQLYLSALDLKLHSTTEFWLDIVREMWPQYSLFPLDKRDAHPCSFSPIFSEEWAAAYFCHIWAQVMAADVFSAFEEVGLDNPKELAEVGARLRSTFLSLGGSSHPSEVFRRFRGRDPSANALLWSLGLKQIPTANVVSQSQIQ